MYTLVTQMKQIFDRIPNAKIHFSSSELHVSVALKSQYLFVVHDDVIKWKNLPRYWPFVRGIHRSSVNSPHKVQWRGALVFSLISALTHRCANHRGTGDLRRHRAHYDVTVMWVPSYFWEIKMSNTRIFNVLPYFLPAVHRYQKPVARKYQYTDINYVYFDNDDWLRPAEASVNRVFISTANDVSLVRHQAINSTNVHWSPLWC